MSYPPTEQAKRIQKIVETLDQKVAEATKVGLDLNSMKLALERVTKELDQVRQHLATELAKLDRGMPEAMKTGKPELAKAS